MKYLTDQIKPLAPLLRLYKHATHSKPKDQQEG
jgi:hypothetical protein